MTVDASGDDAVLHDDPGGRVARRAGRRDRRPRPDLRARHGRAGEDPRPRVQHDPPLGQGAAAAGRHETGPNDIAIKFVGARPGEKLHEELWGDDESVGATDASEDHAPEPAADRPRRGSRSSSSSSSGSPTKATRSRSSRSSARSSREPKRETAFAHAVSGTKPADRPGYGGASLDAERIFAGLNAEQRAAVEATRGPVCILAGAGTGKTTTITRRIAWQVASGAFAPAELVAVTFTDKAAGELRARLAALGVEGVRASTFHSAALALLRRFAGDPGRILSTKALLLRQIGNRLPAPYKFRPGGRSRDGDRVGEEPPADAADVPRGARRPRAAAPGRSRAPRLPRVRAAQGRGRARSTSRTCSSVTIRAARRATRMRSSSCASAGARSRSTSTRT